MDALSHTTAASSTIPFFRLFFQLNTRNFMFSKCNIKKNIIKNIVAEKWYWPDVPVYDPSLARLPEINAESGLYGMRN